MSVVPVRAAPEGGRGVAMDGLMMDDVVLDGLVTISMINAPFLGCGRATEGDGEISGKV